MEFSLPVFPNEPGAQAAFIAAAFVGMVGLLLVLVPGPFSRLIRLEAIGERLGGNSEFRAAGGFLFGLSLITLLFDQPVSYTVMGLAIGASVLGRCLSLAIDRQAIAVDGAILVLQAALALALLTYLFDVIAPDMAIVMPPDPAAFLVFLAYWALVALGLVLMFSPRPLATMMGSRSGENHALRLSSLRSAGGFAIGLGLSGLLFANPMVELGVAAALILSLVGRIAGLVFDRGHLGFNLVAFVLQVGAAAIFANFISAMM